MGAGNQNNKLQKQYKVKSKILLLIRIYYKIQIEKIGDSVSCRATENEENNH